MVLCTCHLGGTAGAIVSTAQGCPGVHHPLVTLVAQVELAQNRGLGLTEVAGWIGLPGTCPHYKGGGGT